MKFNDLIKAVLESTTDSVGMGGGSSVFSSDKVYASGDLRKPSLIGGNTIIRRTKPELLSTPLFKGIKKVTSKRKSKSKSKKKKHK